MSVPASPALEEKPVAVGPDAVDNTAETKPTEVPAEEVAAAEPKSSDPFSLMPKGFVLIFLFQLNYISELSTWMLSSAATPTKTL